MKPTWFNFCECIFLHWSITLLLEATAKEYLLNFSTLYLMFVSDCYVIENQMSIWILINIQGFKTFNSLNNYSGDCEWYTAATVCALNVSNIGNLYKIA